MYIAQYIYTIQVVVNFSPQKLKVELLYSTIIYIGIHILEEHLAL